MAFCVMLALMIAVMPFLNTYAFGLTIGGVYLSGYALAGLCALCGVSISATVPDYVWQDIYNDISNFASDTSSALYQSASDVISYCADYGAKVSSATGELIEVSGINLSNAISGMKNILNSHYLDATTSGVNLAYKFPGLTYGYSQNVPILSTNIASDLADAHLSQCYEPWLSWWSSVVGSSSTGSTLNFKQLENYLTEFGYPFVEFAFSSASITLAELGTLSLESGFDYADYGGRAIDCGNVKMSHQNQSGDFTTDGEITALMRYILLPVLDNTSNTRSRLTVFAQCSTDGGSTWLRSTSIQNYSYTTDSLISVIAIPSMFTNSQHTVNILNLSLALMFTYQDTWKSSVYFGQNTSKFQPKFNVNNATSTYQYYSPISGTDYRTMTVTGSGITYPVDTSPDVYNPGASVGGNSISGQYNPDVADRTGAITGGADVVGVRVPVLDGQDVYNPSIDAVIGSGTLTSDVVIGGTTVATGTDVLTGIQTAVGDIATTTDTVLDTSTDVPDNPTTPDAPTFPDIFPGLWDWVNGLVDNALQWFIFCGDVFSALPGAIKYTFLGGMTTILAVGVIKKLLF